MVTLCVATALVGYSTLHTSGELHRRNMLHVTALLDARTLLSDLSAPEDARAIGTAIARARTHAAWCLDKLDSLANPLVPIEGARAMAWICAEDLSAADRGLRLAEAAAEGRIALDAFLPAMTQVIDEMTGYSIEFEPHVNRYERLAFLTVGSATALLGALMVVLQKAGSARAMGLWTTVSHERTRFDAALGAMEEGVAIFDPQDNLVAWNRAYAALCAPDPRTLRRGMSRTASLRAAVSGGVLEVSGPLTGGAGRAPSARLDAGDALALDLADGRHVLMRQTRSALGDRVVVASDRTVHRREAAMQERHARALEAANREVARKALEDPLTGLPNRRAFEEVLGLRDVAPDAAEATTLVRVDLDHFKYVNDVLGHAAGDAALIHVGEILRSETRPGGLAARLGGDEFALLLPAGEEGSAGEALADRLRQRIRTPFFHESKSCIVGASFGIASNRAGPKDADELLSFADIALYEAKRKGRDRTETFTPRTHERLRDNRRLADELRLALERGEFEPFFQPQVDAQTLEITGAEVLARWRHPTAGLRSPGAFLEIAHQLRLTAEIDAQILQRAGGAVAELQALGLCPPKVSFNVSSQRMHDPALLEAVRGLAARGPRVALELLEATMIEEESAVFSFHLDSLKEEGIGIEIDDFGSGHASLLGVMRAGPDTLKIDQRLIRPLPDSENLQRLVRAIVEIGRALGVSVTAEGVETMEHAQLLAALGCRTLQGFAFAPALSVDDFAAFARAYGTETLPRLRHRA
jgi:diguanylate cyclase (GGDEF)-like protein